MEHFFPYQLNRTEQEDQAKRTFLAEQLRQLNNVKSPAHLHVRTHPPKPLDFYLESSSGEVVGGLVAGTYWSWLEIETLWLAEELRGRGYGQRLLQLAEAEAVGRSCRHAFLTTYSFQARGFYEKAGYHVVGTLDDYPPGMSYYWLRKDF